MFRKLFIFALGLSFIPLSAMAGSDKADKLAKALEKYEKTGKVERCVRLTQIYSSRVIDDNHIVFIMRGKKAYLNTLPRRCSRLGFEKAFSYKVSMNQLCNVDIITVFDSTGGIQGPSCGLGKFVEYKKKPKVEKSAD
ncbi:MAG: hypothetical protein COB54_08205 [Alphaproteobacteria bacterium]|nr:MAG: hypothetical protein COB54_08205 [Alphaproteobacteria bacterium]